MKEKTTLVLFTLLAQAGIGLGIAARVLGADRGLDGTACWGGTGLAALGLGAAFLHLGRPFSAHRALANLKTSWLSRECLLLGGFLALGVVRLALESQGVRSAGLEWLWVLAGGLGLVSMASIYGPTAMPAWTRTHTHISFHTAALALGALALGALGAGSASGAGLEAGCALLAAGAVTVQLVEFALYLAGARPGVSPALAVGLALTAAGGLACPVLALAFPQSAAGWLAPGAALLAAGQALLRHAYYASGVHAMDAGWADIAYRPEGRHARQR